jgi:hypothetical protein
VSVSCSTQCPETPTWRDECGNVHYQAGLSTAFTEVGPLLWWSAAMEGTVGRRGCKLGMAIGGALRAMLNMDFRERRSYEVRPRSGELARRGTMIRRVVFSEPYVRGATYLRYST